MLARHLLLKGPIEQEHDVLLPQVVLLPSVGRGLVATARCFLALAPPALPVLLLLHLLLLLLDLLPSLGEVLARDLSVFVHAEA